MTAGQTDGEAGWWTTSGNIGLPPQARVMGVGRQHTHIDTGAGADLMNYNDFLSLKNRHRLKHSNVLLSDYNDNSIKVKECCVWCATPRGSLVMDPGCDTSERLDLVHRVYNVDMKECVLSEKPNILNCLPFRCNIKLKANSEPIIHTERRVPATLRDKLKVELKRMVKLGVQPGV